MNILVFGSLNIDNTYSVEEIVKPGQNIISEKCSRHPGGKGLNQSIAIARAGSEVCSAGMIGEDGLFLKALLEKDKVDCSHIGISNEPTGNTFIQVDRHGQNCIVAYGGANREITAEYCDKVIESFGTGDFIILQNEISEVGHIIDKAHVKGMKIFFNPSPVDRHIAEYDMSNVDFFIMNETEGLSLTGETEPDKVLDAMLERFPDSQTVLTLGETGSYYADKNRRFFCKAYPARAVDSTGAGDTFTGYLVSALADGIDIAKAMDTASLAAAIEVGKPGAAESIPYLKEVIKG